MYSFALPFKTIACMLKSPSKIEWQPSLILDYLAGIRNLSSGTTLHSSVEARELKFNAALKLQQYRLQQIATFPTLRQGWNLHIWIKFKSEWIAAKNVVIFHTLQIHVIHHNHETQSSLAPLALPHPRDPLVRCISSPLLCEIIGLSGAPKGRCVVHVQRIRPKWCSHHSASCTLSTLSPFRSVSGCALCLGPGARSSGIPCFWSVIVVSYSSGNCDGRVRTVPSRGGFGYNTLRSDCFQVWFGYSGLTSFGSSYWIINSSEMTGNSWSRELQPVSFETQLVRM